MVPGLKLLSAFEIKGRLMYIPNIMGRYQKCGNPTLLTNSMLASIPKIEKEALSNQDRKRSYNMIHISAVIKSDRRFFFQKREQEVSS